MLGTVLVLALIAACEPVRLGTAVFLVSGPRPLVNLRAFWLGSMTMAAAGAVIALLVLRDFELTIVHGLQSLTASPSTRGIPIAAGVVALLIAALLLAFSARQPTLASMPGDDRSAPAPQPSAPTVFARLSARGHNALGSGIPWMAYVGGLCLSMSPAEFTVALGTILASGAAAGTQISAVVVFAVVSFVIFEIPLVSYLVTPAKTQAKMLQLHNWVRPRRRQILALIIGAAGVFLVAKGIGSI